MYVDFWAGVTYLLYTVLMNTNKEETHVDVSKRRLRIANCRNVRALGRVSYIDF